MPSNSKDMVTERCIILSKLKKTKLSSDWDPIRSSLMMSGILEPLKILKVLIPLIPIKSSLEDSGIFILLILNLDPNSSQPTTTTNHLRKFKTLLLYLISFTNLAFSPPRIISHCSSPKISSQAECITQSLTTTEDGKPTSLMISFQFMKRAESQSGVWTLNNHGN